MIQRITQAEFARLCDINRSSVSRAIKRGRITLSQKRIELTVDSHNPEGLEAAALALWINTASSDPHHQARLQHLLEGRERKRALLDAAGAAASPETEGNPDHSLDILNKRIKSADAMKRENDARTAEIQRLALEGEYLLREAVYYALNDHTAILRRELDNLADRLAPIVHPMETIEEQHAAIARSAEEILQMMHKSMQKAKEVSRELNR